MIMQGCNCGLSFGIGSHFDETETLATTCLTILNHFGAGHCPVLTEQLLQFRAAHAVTEVAYIQLLTHHRSPTNWIRTTLFLRFPGPLRKVAAVSALQVDRTREATSRFKHEPT